MRSNIVLFNPSSGKGRSLKKKEHLSSALNKYSIEHEFIITKSEAHLRELVHTHADAKSIIAVGGDSTITIAADEIIKGKHNVTLGLIPLGSSDDIALDYGITDLEKAVSVIHKAETRQTDIGKITENGNTVCHFLGQANIGIGVAVNRYVANAVHKNRFLSKNQTLAGLAGMMHAYKKHEVPVQAHIVHPEENMDGEFTSLLFSKIRYWASGLLYAPSAKPDDGDLHAVFIKSCPLLRLLRLTQLAANGRHVKQEETVTVSANKFRVRLNSPFQIQVDGDILQQSNQERNFTEVEFSTLPLAIKVFR
ncbi:MAG: diacylglycerol kinase family protein [Leptospirales bacterium]